MTTFSPAWRPQSAKILAYVVAVLSVTAALVVGLLLDGVLHTMASVSLPQCAGDRRGSRIFHLFFCRFRFLESRLQRHSPYRSVRRHRDLRGLAQHRAKTQ